MKYSPENVELIKNAILECEEMLKTLPAVEDSGSSNFDRVVVDFSGWRKNQIDKIPLLGHKHTTGLFKGYCSIRYPTNGQGHNNTHRVEAAAKFLREKGVECSIHYQMD